MARIFSKKKKEEKEKEIYLEEGRIAFLELSKSN